MIYGDEMTNQNITYVALGDSLTANVGIEKYAKYEYPYGIGEKFYEEHRDKNFTLHNLSLPGARSEDIINVFLEKTIEKKPDIVTLLIGINDVHGNISKAQFKNNYETILKKLTTETQAKVYAIAIPLLGSPSLFLPPYRYYFDTRTKNFNEVIREVASDHSIPYIDLYTPTKDIFAENGPHYSTDYFHPSALGYSYFTKTIYDALDK